MEIELKLLVASQDTEALRHHPLLKKYGVSPPHVLDMSDIYFDTAELNLCRCGAGLRVRKVGRDWIQTIKGGGSVEGGLHKRHEWESHVIGPRPDLAVLREQVDHTTEWGQVLHSPIVEDHLLRIFTTKVKRTVWALHLPHGDEVELVLDQGNIEYGSKKTPISEIELELKSGDAIQLFDLALALQQDIPMHIGNQSKAERGYALYAPQPSEAVKAEPLSLSKSMTIEQAFQSIAINCMAQIQGNANSVAYEQDVESLHQMRVGLRRLRSALSLFRGVIQPPETLQQELDWLAAELGAARDWDVMAYSTLSTFTEVLPGHTFFEDIKLAAIAKAQQKHETVSACINSQRYTRLILSFMRWVLGSNWRETATPQMHKKLATRLTKFSHNILHHHQERLHKHGKKLHDASPKQRHQTRIAAKKLRYATEFFQSLYPAKWLKPYVKALENLQDELGRLNDATVADRLLQELEKEQPNIGTKLMREYLVSTRCSSRKIGRYWKKFAAINQLN